jgi:hypothetical protein
MSDAIIEDDVDTSPTMLNENVNMTVAQLAEALQIRPQIVNAWVKQGCPVESEKPRTLNYAAVMDWKASHDKEKASTPRAPREKAPRVKPDGTLAGPDEEGVPETRALEKLGMTKSERNIFAWSRGEGRGWALGKPLERNQPIVDDYIDLVNHAGKPHPTSGTRLLQEAREGTLFVVDLDMAVAFLAGQVKGVINEQAQPSDYLLEAQASLEAALENILAWKKQIAA